MDIPHEKPKRRLDARKLLAGGAVLVVVLLGAFVIGLEPAVPAVESSTAWTDVVRRGSMLLAVRGPGRLVPERSRYVAALTAGRVERRRVEPGARVGADSVLLELSNPDVRLEALEAERQLSEAEATLATLRAELETQRLNQEGVIAGLEREAEEARRTADARAIVAAAGGIAALQLENAERRARELAERLELERRRLDVLVQSSRAQLANQENQVARARAVARFQRERVASLRVRAGSDGVVQEVEVDEGQWVTPGTTLARVVQPELLKAQLRIPEVQARDLAIGQSAVVDLRSDTLMGHVVRIDPAAQGGTVTVDVGFGVDSLPAGARPDLTVQGRIEIARLDDVLHVGRPAYAGPRQVAAVWRLDGHGYADRVTVQFGRASVDLIEIEAGLDVGDTIVLAEIPSVGDADRIRLN